MLQNLEIKSNIIELKFEGNGINPNKLSNSEIAELLIAFEKSIVAVTKYENPEITFDDFDGLMFYDIGNKSLSLRSTIDKYKKYIKQGVVTLALAANSLTFDTLPSVAKTHLDKINKFTNKYNCEARIGYSKHKKFVSLAELKFKEKSKYSRFKQQVQIYGKLINIQSDIDKIPKGSIRQVNGQLTTFNLSYENVKEYRQYLSEEVKATGEATINGENFKTTSFRIEELIPYKLLSLDETIDAIRKIAT